MKKLLLVFALVAGLLPVLPARAAPRIQFLNPSGYSTTMTISDQADTDSAYHLVAWVGEVPANPLVEFEFTSAAGTPNLTLDGTRVGVDTWDAHLSLTGLSDGQYILRTRLYENFTGPGTGSEVAAAEQIVTVNASNVPPPPTANTVEITYPLNGDTVGFFTPAGKRTNLLIDGIASELTESVRVLYTTSAPGADPEWTGCGGAGVASDRTVRARCTLAEGVGGSQVTAVAMVANDTPPPATPTPVADATGDAHRVTSVAQTPTRLVINPESLPAEVSSCPVFVVNVHDQSGRPIAAANIDVHALGPDDQIQFGIIERTTSPQAGVLTSEFQAPDRGHSSSRAAHNCGNNEPEGRQGDHNVPGANDAQHIESTDGTDNSGNFVFALRSTTNGGTQVEAWVDENDDDLIQGAETSGGSQIGWGVPPPPPARSVLLEPVSTSATTGDCQRVAMTVREGGSPLVSVNVDVHVSGPTETVAFCSPGTDASVRRDPDSGAHIGGSDDAETRHTEGETDASGRFIFGVTSAAEGSSAIVAWLDTPDDDVLSNDEVSRRGEIAWTVSGDRSISISSNKNRVRKGRFVRISGRINGQPACAEAQTVQVKSKRVKGGRFRTVATVTTDAEGDYSARIRVRKSKKYRAIAPASGACETARSRTITVRARR